MTVIEEVRREREDLARVLKKHAGIRRIVEELYPDSAHFIYELLQNAEDTNATEASFTLTKESLIFEHNGRPFNREDIFAITDIGEGTKAGTDDKIGRFGVGFKAVFAYSETPMIWSPTYSFKVSELVLPSALDQIRELGNRTRFEFPFNNKKKNQNDAFAEIKKGLNELAETTLIFLSNLKNVIWKIDFSYHGNVQRVLHSKNHIEVVKRIDGEVSSSAHFLKFDTPVVGLEKQRLAIAFALDFVPNVSQFNYKIPLDKQLKIIPASPGCVAVFFPAEKETSGLRFHLHAPFVPELSRASIKETTSNYPLFEQLAKLTAASLHEIRDIGLLNTEFLAVLPNLQDPIPPRYECIRVAIIYEMNNKPLTPTYTKSHAPARRLIQAKAALKELLNENDIEILVDYDEESPMWAISAAQKNSNVDRFLSGLAINDWDIEQFVEMLRNKMRIDSEDSGPPVNLTSEDAKSWLSGKSIEWHQKLYALLYKELETEGELSRLKKIQFVRLADGTYMCGNKCYFPSENVSAYDEIMPRVDSGIYLFGKSRIVQENAKKLLKGVGVRDVGEVELIEAILDKNYKSSSFNPNIKDISRFIEFFENEPSRKNVFTNYHIFKREDGKWATPNRVFLDKPFYTTNLSSYYELLDANTRCYALHSDYIKCGVDADKIGHFAKSLGVKVSLEITKVSCWQNPYIDHLIHRAPGRETYLKHDEDYNIISLEKLISFKSVEISILIWDCISKSIIKWNKAFYRRNAQQNYRTAPSQLASILEKSAWIPQGDDVFVCPKDASFKLLPKGFPIDKSWEWLKDIKFGEKEELRGQSEALQSEETRQREGVMRELGFSDVDSLKRAQRFAALSPEEQEHILATSECRKTTELPEHLPSNPNLRESRVGEQAFRAPERLAEEKTLTVSVGLAGIKEEAAEYLLAQYYCDDVMLCQICKTKMPFVMDDYTPYFEKVEFLSDLKMRHYQNYLALCPNHSAMFKYVNGSINEIRDKFTKFYGNHLSLTLAKKTESIYFTKTHIHDLRTVLKIEDDLVNDSRTISLNPLPVVGPPSQLPAPGGGEVITLRGGKEVVVYQKTSISSTKHQICPLCQAKVNPENFENHIKKKCPKRTAQIVNVNLENKSSLQRCRDCGSPVIPGSDRCYSCSSG